MAIRTRISKPFTLESWYASEGAKRSFGRICQAVNEQGGAIALLGTEEKPMLVLADADDHPEIADEIAMTIEEVRADWPAVTSAALLGTQFRIRGKKVMRAVLFRHPEARHPAERYLRSRCSDANALAQRLETLAKEVRMLGQQLKRFMENPAAEFAPIADRLARSAEVIDRRFKEAWRLSNGYGGRA